jgi:hypothetical protein
MNQLIHQISFGNKSYIELNKSIDSIYRYIDNIDIRVLGDKLINKPNTYTVLVNQLDTPIKSSRYYKTKLNEYSSNYNLYLDSDTLVKSKDILNMFRLLDNYDLVISYSQNQDSDAFWHIDELERNYTYEQLGYTPVQYQAGVFSWRQNKDTDEFFRLWHSEWSIFEGQDQAAFVRALHKKPLKVYLVGNAYNSSNGAILEHHFGKIR